MKIQSKVSGKDGVVSSKWFFTLILKFSASFYPIIEKLAYFSLLSMGLYRKIQGKHVCLYPDMFPKVS